MTKMFTHLQVVSFFRHPIFELRNFLLIPSSFVLRISSFSLSLVRHGRRLEPGKTVAVDAYVADLMLFRNCARPQAGNSLLESSVENHPCKSKLKKKEK